MTTMPRLSALLLPLCLLAAVASGRELLQQQGPSPRQVTTSRIRAPCLVPSTYYPFRTCRVESNPQVCARGFNAWPTIQECCAPGRRGAFAEGCTDFSKNVTCFTATSFWPVAGCGATNNRTICAQNWGVFPTMDTCCRPGAAFPNGCTRTDSCWAASSFFPNRACGLVQDSNVCSRGWGVFSSQQACCDPGAAFGEGCTPAEEWISELPPQTNDSVLDS